VRPRASAWIVVAAAVLAGCAIGPDYKRPAVIEPQTFRGQATAEAASLADAAWWEVFQDPILKELIREALRNNYDVRLAAARVQEARAGFVATRSDLFPSLDYGGAAGRSNATPGLLGTPGQQAPTTSNFYSLTLAMSWELDVWGRIRRSTEAARATLLATEDFRRGVWLTLVSDLAQAYFELLALDVQLQIARNSTDAYQRTYDLFLDRFQLGVASKLETARAEGALGGAQATVPQLESKQQLVSANARIGVAKAEFFPKFSLTPLIGTASPEFSALTSGSATIWAVAGTLTGPLFNAGRTLGNYRATVAQWEQAKLLYEQAALTALREVSDALTALGKLSEAEIGQDRSVKALADAVDRATDRYRQGLANYFEVLEAQQQLYPAQSTLAQIRRDRLLSHVRLYRALGGGWSLTDAQWQDQAHQQETSK
jgi:multidrug efflux system outer membrane protein